jgi:uncharacterized protein (TIGR03067 family)
MKPLIALLTLVVLAVAAPAAEIEPGFKSLFNGKDLTGWEGNPDLWSVRDGAITGQTRPDPANPSKSALAHNTFLVWKGGEVAGFELRLQYRIVGGNSGIQYRSRVVEQGAFGPIVAGYQADFEAGKTYSGILYEERGRGILAQRGQKAVVKPGDGKRPRIEVTGSLGPSDDIQAKIRHEDWNDYVVIARGNHLQHFINGVQTVDVVDEDTAHAAKSGVLAFQIHAGPPMTVQFRDIRLKELGAKKSGAAALQGRWALTEVISKGKPLPRQDLAAITVTFAEGRYTIGHKDGDSGGVFRLDDARDPKWMDVTTESGDYLPAIYALDGDALRICAAVDGAPRPSEFASNPGSDHGLVIYRRTSE